MSKSTIISNNKNSIIIGKAAVNGSIFKIDGVTYKTTERFNKTLEKLELDGRVCAFKTDENGNVDTVALEGAMRLNGVEVEKYDGSGTIKVPYLVFIGTACNIKEGNPLRFSVAYSSRKNGERTSRYEELKAWGDVAERAAAELVVPEGEKKPRVWVVCTEGKPYNERQQLNVQSYGIITD